MPKMGDVSSKLNDDKHPNDCSRLALNYFNVGMESHDATALIDTGADYFVSRGKFTRRLRKVMTRRHGPQIRTAVGRLIKPIGRCIACVEIRSETCPV